MLTPIIAQVSEQHGHAHEPEKQEADWHHVEQSLQQDRRRWGVHQDTNCFPGVLGSNPTSLVGAGRLKMLGVNVVVCLSVCSVCHSEAMAPMPGHLGLFDACVNSAWVLVSTRPINHLDPFGAHLVSVWTPLQARLEPRVRRSVKREQPG